MGNRRGYSDHRKPVNPLPGLKNTGLQVLGMLAKDSKAKDRVRHEY